MDAIRNFSFSWFYCTWHSLFHYPAMKIFPQFFPKRILSCRSFLPPQIKKIDYNFILQFLIIFGQKIRSISDSLHKSSFTCAFIIIHREELINMNIHFIYLVFVNLGTFTNERVSHSHIHALHSKVSTNSFPLNGKKNVVLVKWFGIWH